MILDGMTATCRGGQPHASTAEQLNLKGRHVGPGNDPSLDDAPARRSP
jgi:hypothetical protein